MSKACGVLAIWKKTEGPADPGSLLFRKFYELAGELEDASYWRVAFSAADPVQTPRGFNTANTKAATLLADAVQWFATNKFDVAEVNARKQVIVRDSAPISCPAAATPSTISAAISAAASTVIRSMATAICSGSPSTPTGRWPRAC